MKKLNPYTMAEQIENLDKKTDQIQSDLRSYITEDRGWKDNLCDKLDGRYANKDELTHLKVLVYGLVALIAGIGTILFPFFLE